MPQDVTEFRTLLLRGIQLSQQGSYARRAPDLPAVPYLTAARDGLQSAVSAEPDHAAAWRLLSQAQECLLHYRSAIESLETALRLEGAPGKSDRKRLALLRESLREWEHLPLSPAELQQLGECLAAAGVDDEVRGRTLDVTRRWLEAHVDDVERVLAAFGRRGAWTDFQVLYNVVRG